MTSILRVRVLRLDPGISTEDLPRYQTDGASGMDLRACLDAPVDLPPGGRCRIPTGLAFAIPPGWEGQVRPRSGLALRAGLTVLNAPGTVDSDYRGEVQVILVNLGDATARVEPGERIAQLVFCPVGRAVLEDAADGLPGTPRGEGGFGHTGSS
ncbi:MAG: dUTP diphosphatase [Deltaproteobacteria bacterium]|nr:dUTP diphosphatase [Deltaproteobacteria bacterium]